MVNHFQQGSLLLMPWDNNAADGTSSWSASLEKKLSTRTPVDCLNADLLVYLCWCHEPRFDNGIFVCTLGQASPVILAGCCKSPVWWCFVCCRSATCLLFYFGLLHIDELTHSKLKADLLQVILRTYKTCNQQKLVWVPIFLINIIVNTNHL